MWRTYEGPIVSETDKLGIKSGNKIVFVIAAVRFDDSLGEHETHLCRLQETHPAGSTCSDVGPDPRGSDGLTVSHPVKHTITPANKSSFLMHSLKNILRAESITFPALVGIC
jgi:hypothetical protein